MRPFDAEDRKEASAQMHNTIASLSPTEFPNLTELREALVAETVQAGAAKPSPDVTAEYADRLASALSVESPRGGARTTIDQEPRVAVASNLNRPLHY